MEKINFVKLNLSFYLPALMEYTSDINLDWDDIDRRFSEEHEKRKEDLIKTNQESKRIEATIYDIIVEAKKENQQALRLLHFLNRMFSELTLNTNNKEQQFIKKNIVDFLTSMGKDYLNYVGEIAVLNNLLSQKKYILEGVEEELSNGKSIDFKLKRIEDDFIVLVEIESIHIDSDKVENEEEKIKTFFDYRFEKKIKKKKKDLIEDIDFTLITVLWGGWEDLKTYSDYFKKNKTEIENVHEPVAYLAFSNEEGFFVNRFGSVSNLFNSN